MLNLIGNLLNFFLALGAAEEPKADPPQLHFRRGPEYYSVSLQGKEIFRDSAFHEHLPVMVREGFVGNERFFLLENSKSDGCPAEYVLIAAHYDGSHRLFRLGNCETVKIEASEGQLKLTFPGFNHSELSSPRLPEAWIYKDMQLQRVSD
jgi:hypothetical protein